MSTSFTTGYVQLVRSKEDQPVTLGSTAQQLKPVFFDNANYLSRDADTMVEVHVIDDVNSNEGRLIRAAEDTEILVNGAALQIDDCYLSPALNLIVNDKTNVGLDAIQAVTFTDCTKRHHHNLGADVEFVSDYYTAYVTTEQICDRNISIHKAAKELATCSDNTGYDRTRPPHSVIALGDIITSIIEEEFIGRLTLGPDEVTSTVNKAWVADYVAESLKCYYEKLISSVI